MSKNEPPMAFVRPLFVIDGWRVSLTTTYYRWPLRTWSLNITSDAALREREERILRNMRTYYIEDDTP